MASKKEAFCLWNEECLLKQHKREKKTWNDKMREKELELTRALREREAQINTELERIDSRELELKRIIDQLSGPVLDYFADKVLAQDSSLNPSVNPSLGPSSNGGNRNAGNWNSGLGVDLEATISGERDQISKAQEDFTSAVADHLVATGCGVAPLSLRESINLSLSDSHSSPLSDPLPLSDSLPVSESQRLNLPFGGALPSWYSQSANVAAWRSSIRGTPGESASTSRNRPNRSNNKLDNNPNNDKNEINNNNKSNNNGNNKSINRNNSNRNSNENKNNRRNNENKNNRSNLNENNNNDGDGDVDRENNNNDGDVDADACQAVGTGGDQDYLGGDHAYFVIMGGADWVAEVRELEKQDKKVGGPERPDQETDAMDQDTDAMEQETDQQSLSYRIKKSARKISMLL
jgi:hypothetical protein